MAEEKISKFKGRTLQELNEMSMDEFNMLLNSSCRRKIKRGFTEQENKLLKKINNNEKNIKTHCRDMVVLPLMVDKIINIYSGKEFVPIKILVEHVGMRFGELVPTRKIGIKHAGSSAKAADETAAKPKEKKEASEK